MKIKALRLEQFKGVADSTFEFSERTKICGQNGAGKSTISDAIYFLILGKNYQLRITLKFTILILKKVFLELQQFWILMEKK